jgi:hypothetical protein
LDFTPMNAQGRHPIPSFPLVHRPSFPLAQKENCNHLQQTGHCQLQIGFNFFPLMAPETMTLRTTSFYLASWAANVWTVALT